MIADAVYGAAERDPDRPTASELAIARARGIIKRFLRELPGETTVAELRAELDESE